METNKAHFNFNELYSYAKEYSGKLQLDLDDVIKELFQFHSSKEITKTQIFEHLDRKFNFQNPQSKLRVKSVTLYRNLALRFGLSWVKLVRVRVV